jgi:predicted oxidoreductase
MPIFTEITPQFDFGKAFSSSKIAREKLQFHIQMWDPNGYRNRKTVLNITNILKRYIIWSVENSLKNLQTDYLDVFLLHRPSPLMRADEIAEAVLNCNQTGKLLILDCLILLPHKLN